MIVDCQYFMNDEDRWIIHRDNLRIAIILTIVLMKLHNLTVTAYTSDYECRLLAKSFLRREKNCRICPVMIIRRLEGFIEATLETLNYY